MMGQIEQAKVEVRQQRSYKLVQKLAAHSQYGEMRLFTLVSGDSKPVCIILFI